MSTTIHCVGDKTVRDPNSAMLLTSKIRKVVASNAECRKETHYHDSEPWTKFVPFAIKTSGALSARSDCLLIKCAPSVSRVCANSRPSASLLRTLFRHRESITLHRSLAHSIYATFLRLQQPMAFLPYLAACSPFISETCFLLLVWAGAIETRCYNETGFLLIFNDKFFLLIDLNL